MCVVDGESAVVVTHLENLADEGNGDKFNNDDNNNANGELDGDVSTHLKSSIHEWTCPVSTLRQVPSEIKKVLKHLARRDVCSIDTKSLLTSPNQTWH